jgi:hypothetical protein
MSEIAIRRYQEHPEIIRYGEQSHLAKLTNESVLEIRRLYALGDITYQELGRLFGVKQATIGYLVRRKSWTHI